MAINTGLSLVKLVGSTDDSLVETSSRIHHRSSKGLVVPISHPLTVTVHVASPLTVPTINTMSTAPSNLLSVVQNVRSSPVISNKTSCLLPPSTLSLSLLSPPTTPGNGTPPFKRAISAPATSKTSRRTHLGPGCSMLDWIRLCKNTPDMAGNGGSPIPVTEEELGRHCTEQDAWTSYKGKVYNITAYFRFHPGGKEDLMKAVGRDCTLLFDEAHKWVNIQSMLKKCYVGDLVTSAITRRGSLLRARSGSKTGSDLLLDVPRGRAGSKTGSDLLLSVPRPYIVVDGMNRHAVAKRESESSEDALVHTPQSPVNPPFHVTDETDSTAVIVVPPSPIRKNSNASRPTVPHWDWNQTDKNIVIRIITHNKNLKESDIVADISGQRLEGDVLIDNWIFQLKIDLLFPVTDLHVSVCTTKVELRLTKEDCNLHWKDVGTLLAGNDQMVAISDRGTHFRQCTIKSIESITYDTKLFKLALTNCSHMIVPIGYHVDIKGYDNDQEIERSYTPVQSFGLPSSSSPSTDIQLMIKLYSDGAMSKHLLNLQEGDTIDVGNPKGTFDCSRLQGVTEAILIAAGSGFTPMVSVLNQLLQIQSEDQQDDTKRTQHFIFANKTQKDILWRKELDNLVKENKSLTVTHILSDPDKSWTGCTGRITQEFLHTHLPLPHSSPDKQLICICGPQPFTTTITSALMELEYPDSSIHVFD